MQIKPFNSIEHFSVSGILKSTAKIGTVSADVGKSSVKSGFKGFAKSGSDLAQDVAKTGGKSGSKLENIFETAARISKKGKVTEEAATEAGEIAVKKGSKSVKETLDTTSKVEGKSLKQSVKKTVKEGIENSGKKSSSKVEFLKKFGEKYGKYIIGGITISTIAGIAGAASEKINNTKYTITSIKKDTKNPSYTIITYTPNDKFSNNDKITISNSDSADSIDGKDIPIYDVIEAGKIKINKSITAEGTKGDLKCQTDFGNQLSNTINQITDPVIEEVVKVGSDVGQNVLDKTFQELGLPKPSDIIDNIKQYWWVILLISLIPIILSSIVFGITQLS